MPIVDAGVLNTTAQVVPNVEVIVQPPRVSLLQGIPTSIVGLVGTAVWGPVASPQIVSDHASYVRKFGPLQARKFDMGTLLATAVLQGAADFRCVRVTDGTDTAATVTVPADAITFTARYSGSLGNNIRVVLGPGSRANTWKATVFLPEAGILPEVFDNISGTGNEFWRNLANAINDGQSGLRGPSEIIIATAGAGTTAPTAETYQLSGGTDGADGVDASDLIGQDTVPRKGLYALRGSRASVVVLADCDDSLTWSEQAAYARSEGAYVLVAGPKGQTIAEAVAAKQAAGIDDQFVKVIFGDWVMWNDTTNGQPRRLVSPQGFFAGKLGALAPHLSTLNKPMFGIVGTQRSQLGVPYSDAELQELGLAGIDVITNPIPQGFMFGARFGRNSSSDPTIRGDNHTRMTNFIAVTLDAGLGKFVGMPNSEDTRRQVKTALDGLFEAMFRDGMIEAWRTVCNATNNPPERRAAGYLRADIQVRYLSIVEFFIASLEGGQSVVIERVDPAASFAQAA